MLVPVNSIKSFGELLVGIFIPPRPLTYREIIERKYEICQEMEDLRVSQLVSIRKRASGESWLLAQKQRIDRMEKRIRRLHWRQEDATKELEEVMRGLKLLARAEQVLENHIRQISRIELKLYYLRHENDELTRKIRAGVDRPL